jgi:hypothetical protein
VPTARFHQVDEFIEELRRDRDKIDRGLVRVTCRHTRGTPMYSLTVVASAIVGNVVLLLERRCGEYMFPDDGPGRQVRDKAEQYAAALQAECQALGLETRSGVFEAAA